MPTTRIRTQPPAARSCREDGCVDAPWRDTDWCYFHVRRLHPELLETEDKPRRRRRDETAEHPRPAGSGDADQPKTRGRSTQRDRKDAAARSAGTTPVDEPAPRKATRGPATRRGSAAETPRLTERQRRAQRTAERASPRRRQPKPFDAQASLQPRPEGGGGVLAGRDLTAALKYVNAATSRTGQYPTLGAVHVSTENGMLRLVATDKQVMHVVSQPCDGLQIKPCLVDRADVAVSVRSPLATIGAWHAAVESRDDAKQYPPWQLVVEQAQTAENVASFSIDRDELLTLIKPLAAAAKIRDGAGRRRKTEIENPLHIYFQRVDGDERRLVLRVKSDEADVTTQPVVVQSRGPWSLEHIALQHRLLNESVSRMPAGMVRFSFSGATKAIYINSEHHGATYEALIMPVRVPEPPPFEKETSSGPTSDAVPTTSRGRSARRDESRARTRAPHKPDAGQRTARDTASRAQQQPRSRANRDRVSSGRGRPAAPRRTSR